MHSNAIDSEYEIAREAAGWEEIPSSVLRIAGRDRAHWLHKIITADVDDLPVGRRVRSALLDSKGHFVAVFDLLAESEAFLLVAPAKVGAALLTALRKYIIREKVQLQDESLAWRLLSVVGKHSVSVVRAVLTISALASPDEFVESDFLGSPVCIFRGFRASVPSTDLLLHSGGTDAAIASLGAIPRFSTETLEILRVEAGLPRWGVDFDSSTLALEVPEVATIRVDQGCYVGQEVVARLVHRGHVNRLLVGLRFTGDAVPAPGDPLTHEGRPVGTITSTVRSPMFGQIGLGYVRLDVSQSGTIVAVGEGESAVVEKLPFVVPVPQATALGEDSARA